MTHTSVARISTSLKPLTITFGALLLVLGVIHASAQIGPNLLSNSSFETGTADWTVSASPTSAVYASTQGSVNGSYELSFYSTAAYTANVYQTFSGLAAGTYDLKAFAQSSGGQSKAVIYASGCAGASSYQSTAITATSTSTGEWQEPEVANISVTSGSTCVVGIDVSSPASDWMNLDYLRFVKMPSNEVTTNPGFEDGNLTGWEVSGTTAASYAQKGGHSGSYMLSNWSANAYSVTTTQTLTGLANGTYTLSAWVQNGGGQTAAVLEATDCGGTQRQISLPITSYAGNPWTRVVLHGISVSGGSCTVGVSSTGAAAGDWLNIDDFQFVQDNISYSIVRGGDVSMTNLVQNYGGKYYNASGTASDPLAVAAGSGMNLVRLRVYVDPGNASYSPSNLMWPGINTTTDMLNLAQRAKNAGMQIELTFHFSDYWTNPGCQYFPHAWVGLTQSQLQTTLASYVTSVLASMKAQGTLPA